MHRQGHGSRPESPCLPHIIENPERHSQQCVVTSRGRIARHNATSGLLKTALTGTCDHIDYEPVPDPRDRTAQDARRPDLKFEKEKETDGPSASDTREPRYEATPLGGFTSADTTYTSLHTSTFKVLHRQPFLSTSDAYWKTSRNMKTNKHGPQCMPFVVSTYGAVDPDAIQWLRGIFDTASADADAPTEPSTQQRISALVRDIAIATWRHNYDMYKTATRSAELRFGRDAPILNTSSGL